ncbi:MAG: Do family serine endopeptidase [Flammeovirgaceae bacterium]
MKQSVLSSFFGLVGGFLGAYIFFIGWNPPMIENRAIPISTTDSFEKFSPINQTSFSNSFTKSEAMNENISFVKASEVSTKSVVYIKNISQTQYQNTWFDLFFRGGFSEQQVVGSGSGVIFTEDGYIVTNNHVIKDATKLEVIYNKRTFPAEVIGTDPSTDLAVIKINAQNLPAVKIVSSKTIQVGDWVLAVGNPFNLASTVTAGIVSAKGRRINILEDIFPIESFIQTDAAINPGNSGGALVNMNGELVGINTAIISKTGSYAGYGFAVPSDIVLKVFNDLKQYGEVQKAFLGIRVIDLSEKISEKLHTENLDGVVVSTVEKDGAAEKAGIQEGDIIVRIDNTKIESQSTYDETLSYHVPGDFVTIEIKRDGKSIEKKVQLTNIDGTTGIVKKLTYDAQRIGATLETVPKLERSRLGIENGIRIKEIRNGLIRQMELQEGDIIVAVNNYKIEKPEELSEILEKIRGRVVLTVITNDGKQRYYSYYF